MSAADDVLTLAAKSRVQWSGGKEFEDARRHAQRTLEATGGLGGSLSDGRLEGQALANAQSHARRCLESLRDTGLASKEVLPFCERARNVLEALSAGGSAAIEGHALVEVRAHALRCLEGMLEMAPLDQQALDTARQHARRALESIALNGNDLEGEALDAARAHAQRCLDAMSDGSLPIEALDNARRHARLALEDMVGSSSGGFGGEKLEAARTQARLCLEEMAAVETALLGGHGRLDGYESLCKFARWVVFLPRAASREVEQCGVYVKSRHSMNRRFFEDTRDGVQAIINDLDVLHASCVPHRFSEEVLETVLEAQRIANGFVVTRQLHKAMALSELCLSLVDSLAARGDDPLFFWRVLTRTNLGDQYARFKKLDEAQACLNEALALIEEAGAEASPRERSLGATCHAHLGHLHLGAEQLEEAAKHCGLAVEIFESQIWKLSEKLEDREAQVAILATAYSNRGVCAIRQLRHDESLAWLEKAEELLGKHLYLGPDMEEILAHVKAHVLCAQDLKL